MHSEHQALLGTTDPLITACQPDAMPPVSQKQNENTTLFAQGIVLKNEYVLYYPL